MIFFWTKILITIYSKARLGPLAKKIHFANHYAALCWALVMGQMFIVTRKVRFLTEMWPFNKINLLHAVVFAYSYVSFADMCPRTSFLYAPTPIH